MTAVRFAGVTHAYGDQRVLENFNLEIRSGELFTLLGPSGCGKTTLLRIAAGFVEPLSGRVEFDGDDVTRVPPYRRNIGMVFQDYALFPDRSVFENVAYGLRARRVAESEVRRRVGAILERFGLETFADRGTPTLSGGQRQRVAMARALVIEPRLLLLDEPLSALDAKLRIEFREMIQQTQREYGITTLFVTHDQEEALSISDRVALMLRGELVQVATPTEIYDGPANRFAADFIGGANILAAEIIGTSTRSGFVTCRVEDTIVEIAAGNTKLAAGERIGALCIRPEAWQLQRHDDPPAGALRGLILSTQFLGAQITYSVRLDSGTVVRCSAPHRAGSPHLADRDNVYLEVPPEALLLAA